MIPIIMIISNDKNMDKKKKRVREERKLEQLQGTRSEGPEIA